MREPDNRAQILGKVRQHAADLFGLEEALTGIVFAKQGDVWLRQQLPSALREVTLIGSETSAAEAVDALVRKHFASQKQQIEKLADVESGEL